MCLKYVSFQILKRLLTKASILKEQKRGFIGCSLIRYQYLNQSRLVSNAAGVDFKSSAMANNKFQFTNYDCIGFDLDNTVCKYKIYNMMKMEYEVLSKYLVDKKGYSDKYLLRPMDESIDFIQKGLLLDLKGGNVLKIASDGFILRATHGTKRLNRDEINEIYPLSHWSTVDTYVNDPLVTWNGPLSEEVRAVLDYFDTPAVLIFARLIDTVDEKGKPESYDIWADILDGMIYMFQKEHFELNKGEYFPLMKSSPHEYIYKCSDEMIKWFKTLKEQNKFLFLITGSYVDFASLTSSNSIGDQWKELFDLVIFFAKKPGFFNSDRPFLSVKNGKESFPIEGVAIQPGHMYVQGNWDDLYGFLCRHLKKTDPKIVYVGDNLIQDIYTPHLHAKCDTVAIVEELQAEGVFGFPQTHSDESALISKFWGSFFWEKDDKVKNTIWLDIIKKYSKICVPSMEYVIHKPIDYPYRTHYFD